MYVFVLVKCSITTGPAETTVRIKVIDFLAFALNSRRRYVYVADILPFFRKEIF